MLDRLLASLSDNRTLADLRGELSSLAAALTRRHPNARAMVRSAEDAVRLDPARHFSFDSTGTATLEAGGHSWTAGHFETVSIATLRRRVAEQRATAAARARLIVLTGANPLTDIGALQAAAGPGTLFQAASQFNCLESPGPHITPVANYFTDPTQGPRASISAFPATLLRHYAAPRADGSRFVQQSDGEQLDLLARACGRRVSHNGYLTGAGIPLDHLTQSLEQRFEDIEIGLHRDAEVVLGHNWDGAVAGAPRIAQAFTSTLAGGGYGAERILDRHFTPIASHLLRAAYTGTLLGAVSLGCTKVVLTMIGGGVFANPPRLIWQSILKALDEVQPLVRDHLDVVLNAYQLPPELDAEAVVLPEVRKRNGALLRFDGRGLVSIAA